MQVFCVYEKKQSHSTQSTLLANIALEGTKELRSVNDINAFVWRNVRQQEVVLIHIRLHILRRQISGSDVTWFPLTPEENVIDILQVPVMIMEDKEERTQLFELGDHALNSSLESSLIDNFTLPERIVLTL